MNIWNSKKFTFMKAVQQKESIKKIQAWTGLAPAGICWILHLYYFKPVHSIYTYTYSVQACLFTIILRDPGQIALKTGKFYFLMSQLSAPWSPRMIYKLIITYITLVLQTAYLQGDLSPDNLVTSLCTRVFSPIHSQKQMTSWGCMAIHWLCIY